MKKMTLALLLTVSLNANAGLLDFFDFTKFEFMRDGPYFALPTRDGMINPSDSITT